MLPPDPFSGIAARIVSECTAPPSTRPKPPVKRFNNLPRVRLLDSVNGKSSEFDTIREALPDLANTPRLYENIIRRLRKHGRTEISEGLIIEWIEIEERMA